jgi:hypothetical protein
MSQQDFITNNMLTSPRLFTCIPAGTSKITDPHGALRALHHAGHITVK